MCMNIGQAAQLAAAAPGDRKAAPRGRSAAQPIPTAQRSVQHHLTGWKAVPRRAAHASNAPGVTAGSITG